VLVRDAGISRGDLVVDVGAGTGRLTDALARTGARVIALELDLELAPALQRRFEDNPTVTVLEADALDWDWPEEAFTIVSNLPFAGSGAILARLLRDPRIPLRRADVIVQWEFAEKQATLSPATLKGTYWRAWFELAMTHRLSRSAFMPAPEVDAAVLRITRRRQPLVSPAEHDRYWRFLSGTFRSQTPVARALRSQLSPRELRRLADTHGFSAAAWPRDLDARQWAGIFAFSRARGAMVGKTGRGPRSK
jgi:23S rRNA (adenine-N6)-dimethyltransferase